MDPSSPEGRPFQLYISYPVCPGESGTKFKKWRPVLRLLCWICWYWRIRFSVIGIRSKRLNAPREISKKAQMMTTALSTRRPPKRKPTSPGQFGCDKPQARGYTGASSANSQDTGRRNAPRCQTAVGRPQPLMVLQAETDRAQGEEWLCLEIPSTSLVPRPGWSLEWWRIWYNSIKFLIDTGTCFSVLTQRIGNLNQKIT